MIDHLLVRVNDKQDLLLMYNKYLSMDYNIKKSKHIDENNTFNVYI